MDKHVGMIGLGIMGGAMARNLLERGWVVTGFDLDPARQDALREAGAVMATSAFAVAHAAPIVITSLPSPWAARDVAQEIAAAGLSSRIVVETSTLAIADKLAL